MDTKKTEILLWTILVWTLSFLCYLPMLLDKNGVYVPESAQSLKYFFVVMPLFISILFALKQKCLKIFFAGLFAEKIKFRSIFICAILGCIGLLFSYIYAMVSDETDLFLYSYPTVFAAAVNCSYLFVTAFVEEIAWRGFLLNKIISENGKKTAFIYVGLVWSVWHIPMWAIRNSLGFKEILIYFIYTVFISFVLGIIFCTYKNILIVSLSHMIFNTCFIAPVKYNIILLGCILILSIFFFRKRIGTLCK
ncbi:MAG: CPBP family intramembrane metalloprotease [Oscillospiraceae bacterium]|jgi:membrane protease YdiL (CAAX protease family)|nr:CPBP family intramembrane metalloprotease [Oscillospiraceae bacterium]